MVNTEELEKAIKDSGKTKTFLAHKLDITRQALTNKTKNRQQFTGREIMLLCVELNITQLRRKEDIFFVPEYPKTDTLQKGEA